jgi:hypothetical protein
MLIKLLRADRGDNIDLQYIGVLGYCGSRSFESGMLQWLVPYLDKLIPEKKKERKRKIKMGFSS